MVGRKEGEKPLKRSVTTELLTVTIHTQDTKGVLEAEVQVIHAHYERILAGVCQHLATEEDET